MKIIIERSCGMDVHKDSITACIITPEGKEIQTFSTKTIFLLKLIDWIKEAWMFPCGDGKHRSFLETNRKPVGSRIY